MRRRDGDAGQHAARVVAHGPVSVASCACAGIGSASKEPTRVHHANRRTFMRASLGFDNPPPPLSPWPRSEIDRRAITSTTFSGVDSGEVPLHPFPGESSRTSPGGEALLGGR